MFRQKQAKQSMYQAWIEPCRPVGTRNPLEIKHFQLSQEKACGGDVFMGSEHQAPANNTAMWPTSIEGGEKSGQAWQALVLPASFFSEGEHMLKKNLKNRSKKQTRDKT